jgi:hypothetical protein
MIQAGLELMSSCLSLEVLELQACTSTHDLKSIFFDCLRQ